MTEGAAMAMDDRNKGGRSPRGDGRGRSLFVAAASGGIAAVLAKLLGGSHVTALGAAIAGVGLALWIGSMQPSASAASGAASDETTRRQRHRSVAIAVCLGALVAIFYVATIVRLGPNALKRDSFGGSGPTKSAPVDPAACKKAGTC